MWNPFKTWKELIVMWDDIYDEHRYRNSPIRGQVKQVNSYMDSNFTYSGANRLTAYFVMEAFPYQIEVGYLKTLRSVIPEGVSLNDVKHFEPVEIDWNNPALKSRLLILEDISNENGEVVVNAYNKHKHKNDDNRQDRLEESLDYVSEAEFAKDVRVKFFKMRILLVLTGTRDETFQEAILNLENLVKNRVDWSLKRIRGNITEVISSMTPFTADMTPAVKNMATPVFGSDEILSRYFSYEQGHVGRGNIVLGTDIGTGAHVLYRFKKSDSDSEIMMVLGMTGSGKSHLMKHLNLQLMGLENMRGTINDYEGGEYAKHADLIRKYSDVVELDFSLGSGRYYDPVPLKSTGLPEVDSTLLEVSRDHLRALFTAIAGDTIKSHSWIRVIITKGIDAFYKKYNITEDPNTWKVTEGLDVYTVYKFLKSYQPDVTTPEFIEDKTFFIELLSSYFDWDVKANNYFTNKITYDEIANADLVINNFNMKGRNEDSLSDLDAMLIPMNAALISYIRSITSKAQGKFNYKIWEELQRMCKLEGAVTLLKTPLSGGRKLGDINIVASNDPAELLNKDSFNLFDSSNLAMIGKIPSSDTRRRICEKLSMEDMLEELDMIATSNKEAEGDVGNQGDEGYDDVMFNPYKKAFLTSIDGRETTVIKVRLPRWLSDSELFKTGVSQDKSDDVWD